MQRLSSFLGAILAVVAFAAGHEPKRINHRSTYDPIVGTIHTLQQKHPRCNALLSVRNHDKLPLREELQCQSGKNNELDQRYVSKIIDKRLQRVFWKRRPTATSIGAPTTFEWEVCGPFTVGHTNLKISKTPDFMTSESTTRQRGVVTRWHGPDVETSTTTTNKGLFSLEITFSEPGAYYVQATATATATATVLGQDSTKQCTGEDVAVPHLHLQKRGVKAQTNPNWDMSNNGKMAMDHKECISEVGAGSTW